MKIPQPCKSIPIIRKGSSLFCSTGLKPGSISYWLRVLKNKNIILDPGIGFGKTVADNVEIVHNLHKIKELGFPVLIGLSRKSFLGKIINKGYPDLLPVTLAVNTLAILANVDIIRVHDVPEHRDVIDLMTHFNV